LAVELRTHPVGKKPPVDAVVLERVLHAVRAAWADGCPVAAKPDEIAPAAFRRIRSAGRRGVRAGDSEAQVRDLANGLIAAFENNPALVGRLKADYLWLARRIMEAGTHKS
jgi:hypothetical protein